MTESRTSRRAGRRRPRGEQPIVSPAQFTSCYGKPVLNAPVWEPRDIAGYLFLGGLAGASPLLDGPRVRQHAPGVQRARACGSGPAAMRAAGLG
jgi:hypothetical protein